MKKRLLVSMAAAAVLGSSLNAATADDRINAMEAELKALKAELATVKEDDIKGIEDSLSKINRNTNGNSIKWDVDFRTTYDNIQYEMADGSKAENGGLLTNRLWMGMNWLYNENLSFTGQLAYHSTYGQRWSAATTAEEMTNYQIAGFDWVSSEKAYDDELRVRRAYWFLKDSTLGGADIPWTFSIGRRPSTNGKLANYRDDDHAASPIGHAINVEFDGLSAKFGLENYIPIPGFYVKVCAGRGGTYADGWASATPYASNDEQIDLGGAIVGLYDDGQYSLTTMYYYANELIDAKTSTVSLPILPAVIAAYGLPAGSTVDMPMPDMASGFETVGDIESYTASFIANGIGDGISDFLDDTIFFASGSMSKTKPMEGGSMLGSTESETGYSYWIGVQTPGFTEDGRFGLEFNHGSKYWRPVTYGEDTMIGSKIAARGDAVEAYYTQNIIDRALTFQVRFTHINYDYTGSNGFFGSATGTPMSMDEVRAMDAMVEMMTGVNPGMSGMMVEKAQDIRAYIRYRF